MDKSCWDKVSCWTCWRAGKTKQRLIACVSSSATVKDHKEKHLLLLLYKRAGNKPVNRIHRQQPRITILWRCIIFNRYLCLVFVGQSSHSTRDLFLLVSFMQMTILYHQQSDSIFFFTLFHVFTKTCRNAVVTTFYFHACLIYIHAYH